MRARRPGLERRVARAAAAVGELLFPATLERWSTRRLEETLADLEARLAARAPADVAQRARALSIRARLTDTQERAHLLGRYGVELVSRLTHEQADEFVAWLERRLDREEREIERLSESARLRGLAVLRTGDLVLDGNGNTRLVEHVRLSEFSPSGLAYTLGPAVDVEGEIVGAVAYSCVGGYHAIASCDQVRSENDNA